MKILLLNNHSIHLEELRLVLELHEVEVFDKETFDYDSDLSSYDLLILSGGQNVSTVLENPEDYKAQIDLVKNSKIPVLGICLGCEIITVAFGGELMDLGEKHRGQIEIEIQDEQLKTLLDSDKVTVYEGHRIGIKNMPPEFSICATSPHGPEIIKHNTLPILGVQFHPEVKTDNNVFETILRLLEIINTDFS